MIPKEFDYVAPSSIEEALAALRDGGDDAKILAGGHSLIPLLKLRLGAPSRLVDLRRIEDLQQVLPSDRTGHARYGAMVTYKTLMEGDGLLAECAASVGDAQVRARGTIGGSLAHADPAADLPAAILALDATLMAAKLDSDGGMTSRAIAAGDFFVDLLTTALEPGEILTSIHVPALTGRTGTAYLKVRNKASHYALVGVAAVLTLADDGTCSNAAIAVTGAAAKPFRLSGVEGALRGGRLDDAAVQSALGTINDLDVNWMADLHGSTDYRKHLVGIITARAVQMAKSRVAA